LQFVHHPGPPLKVHPFIGKKDGVFNRSLITYVKTLLVSRLRPRQSASRPGRHSSHPTTGTAAMGEQWTSLSATLRRPLDEWEAAGHHVV
jgi:hypothetical protein